MRARRSARRPWGHAGKQAGRELRHSSWRARWVRMAMGVGLPVLAALAMAGLPAASGAAAAADLPACNNFWASPVSGAWDDASMWTNGVPSLNGNDVACVTVAGTYTVTLPDGDFFPSGPIVVGDGTGAGQETLAFPGCPTTSPGESRIFASGSLNVVQGGILDLQGGSSCPGQTVTVGGIVALGATVNLGGTLLVEGQAPTTGPEFIATDTLANTGTITANAQLSLLTPDPTLSFDNTGVINGTQGVLLPETGATATNEGSIQTYVGLVASPLSSPTGSTFANNADGDIGAGGNVQMGSGTTFIQGAGTASAGVASLLSGSNLDIAGSGSGDYSVALGTVDMTGDLGPGQTLVIVGYPCQPPATVVTAGSLTNAGTITMYDFNDTQFCPSGATPQPGSEVLQLPAGDSLTNTGTINGLRPSTATTGTQTISGTVDNAGGTIAIPAISSLSVSPGSLDNSGTVSLAGPLTVSGNYTQEQDGTTEIPVGSQLGNASVHASGNITLGGTLALDNDGVTPPQGSSSTLLSGGSVMGTFGTVTGTDAGNGLVYQLRYTSAAVTVTVEPPIAQSISFTAPASGTVGGSATLTATGGGSGNPVAFSVDPSSGAGVCTVSGANGTTVNYTGPGSCVIDANQAGNTNYTAAPQVTATITVYQAPAFAIDSPPLTAAAGQVYDYTFEASGIPAPAYALAAGAPSWLSVNASTGEITGTPPSGTTSFSYTVTATNTAGTATAGPFTVTVTKASSSNADISTGLACPASLTVRATGTCTLTVANAGPATASKVVAGALLPAALSEVSCTSGCARHANVFTWNLASLASGASAKFAIALKASATGKVLVLAAAASQNADPKPQNNISTSQIAIKP